MAQEQSEISAHTVEGGKRQNSYTDSWSQEIVAQSMRHGRNVGSLIVANAAERDGATIKWHSQWLATARIGTTRMLLTGPACTESSLSAAIVSDKELTKHLLSEAGVQTPTGRLASSAADAVKAQREIAQPVVIKPRFGAMGRGITVNVEEPEDVRTAFRRARALSDNVLVEEFVQGAEYRAHGSSSDCVAVFQRLVPTVTGNGQDTISELVRKKNKIRKLNPNTMNNPIKLDDVSDGFLLRQGLDRGSVIPDGDTIVVKDVNGITSGGDSLECLDSAPEDVRKVSSAAVSAIPGMDWGGTDIIFKEATGEAFVMEVNTFASIGGSVFPVYGKPRHTADEVWRRIRARSEAETVYSSTAPNTHVPTSLTHHSENDGTPVGLWSIFRNHLIDSGYTIQWRSRNTYTASNEREILWFVGCLTASDLTRPQRMLNKQAVLRHLLHTEGVLQPPWRRGSNARELRSSIQEGTESLLLIPSHGRFVDRRIKLLPVQGRVPENSLGATSGVVQIYPTGQRFTVIASRSRALVIVGRNSPEQASIDEIQRLSDRAIEAVRAVPELRWCAVHLVLPKFGYEGEALVEGMGTAAIFHPKDFLLGGSFEELAELVVDGARACP